MNTIVKGLAVAGLSACISTAAAAETLNFGIISTESSQNLKTVWQPFLDAMEEQTGVEVKPFFASDYAGVIEGMRFGKVDVAWFGNKSAMEAVDRAKRRSLRPDRRQRRQPRLLVAPDHPQVDSPLNSRSRTS